MLSEIMLGSSLLDREADSEGVSVCDRLGLVVDPALWYRVEWPLHAFSRHWGDVSAISPVTHCDDDGEAEVFGLHDYYTARYLRPATESERVASVEAAEHDGGAGVILVDDAGRILRADDRGADDALRCYVC